MWLQQVDSEFERKWDKCEDMRYMDTRIDEQQRKLGIKAMPMTLLMPNSKGKSYASESESLFAFCAADIDL
jgi:hypothetical protein